VHIYRLTEYTDPLSKVLVECWINRVMVSSNLARELSAAVGIAASCGYITTRRGRGELFGRQWLITRKGLEWLDDSEKAATHSRRNKRPRSRRCRARPNQKQA
jgi:hypothetical protein